MPETTTSLSMQQDLQQKLDQSVEEVFGMMMGVACTPVEASPVAEGETITAVVGLAGALSGACVVRVYQKVALGIAEALTGMPMTALDETVKDAMGEVCNMVAGAWKGSLPEIAARCMLSVPAVVTGTDYQLHLQRPEFALLRHYCFGEHSLTVNIICEGMQAGAGSR